MFCNDKGYNKRQMIQIFDINGTGLLNRSDFVKVIKNLKLNISIKQCRILMEFVDKQQRGVIQIE